MRGVLSFLAATLALTSTQVASAGEVQASFGPSGNASTWRGDFGAGTGLRIGYRLKDFVSVDFLNRTNFNFGANERLTTFLALGATIYGRLGPVRPYVRAFAVHQHEEIMESVRADPFGSLFGVGAGVRHRAGGGGGLGIEVPIRRDGALQWFFGAGSDITAFGDTRGPGVYVAAGAWLGANYML